MISSDKISKIALGFSILGLVTCLPAPIGIVLGIIALKYNHKKMKAVQHKAIMAIIVGFIAMVDFSALIYWHMNKATALQATVSVPKDVYNVLAELKHRQKQHIRYKGGLATSFESLQYTVPEDFDYAICIPATCKLPKQGNVVVPRILSAHLAVGDCLAAIIGEQTEQELWILYNDGKISRTGPCMANN